MLTGDNEETAKTVARNAGVDDFKSGLLPEEKMDILKELMREVKYVAMTGDGVNDAPAMAEAILGIAMGKMGTDAAIETADVVLMSDDLMKIPWLIRHSRRTLGIIKQNITFALLVKILFMSLSMFGLATLWMAIIADTGASLLVIFNGLRLLRNEKDMRV
jgi:Cd2+/Zn2+-exporting ATPase